MATPALVLPANNQPLVDASGLLTVAGRASLQNALNSLQAQITALAALEGDTTALETALAALQAEVDAAEASIAAHIADTANPHATTAAQVGADPAGTATAAVAAHEAALDPHPQYLTEAAATAGYQPLDATLTALAGANWALNALPIGSGADTVSQVAFAANTFPARGSTGNLVAKTITDGALSAVAGTGGSAGFLRGDGSVTQIIEEALISDGANAGFAFRERTGLTLWIHYADAGSARIFNGVRDVLTIEGAGTMTLDGTLSETELFLQTSGVVGGGIYANNTAGTSYTAVYSANGTVFIRPNGRASSSGEATVSTAGVLTVPTVFASSTLRPGTYTVATLPAAGLVAGMRATVTDATAPTYLGALTGGGSVTCGVIYNGAAWVAG